VTGLDVEVSAEVMDESWPDPKSTGSERSILDLDKIKPPLAVRNMRSGDRFRPLGMDGAKKLSDFFIDLKVPRHLRSYVPLVVDRDGVVLVAGYRPSERVKVDSSTKRVVILTIGRTA
jgi:tRNA(Ile)-lysidine synthase